ncbi:MAG: YraN family protein [Ruminococcus sp.]|nr:YraN family protein [Ruminococcus sp.]
MKTKTIGDIGEEYAVNYLKKHRYKILSRNYRKRFGEIDIIAEKKGTVAFVEVKTRHENPLSRPFEAVDTKKQEKIYRTSLAYIYENDLDCQYRFDVCEVYVNRDTLKLIQINYFDNAFIPESDNGYY